MKSLWFLTIFVSIAAGFCAMAENDRTVGNKEDMLTPLYYELGKGDALRAEIDRFLAACQQETLHHPLQDEAGQIPKFEVPFWGAFGAPKPPGRGLQHHPASDFKLAGGETKVSLYAAQDGVVTTFRDAPKYRHYLAITKAIVDEDGNPLGKLVTIYGHIDLDLNEADGLKLNGKRVKKGELVSRHLYSGTKGGPHLHFEIRFYRPGDQADETFYGLKMPGAEDDGLSEKSAGPWTMGYWNPDIGYGFANPENLGVKTR